jgi:hypothetical protein
MRLSDNTPPPPIVIPGRAEGASPGPINADGAGMRTPCLRYFLKR